MDFEGRERRVEYLNVVVCPCLSLVHPTCAVRCREEWGNPAEEKYFDYMLSYSPLNNVTAQDYPSILITAGLNDPRVAYWEPAKWTATLRAHKTDSNPLLLKVRVHGRRESSCPLGFVFHSTTRVVIHGAIYLSAAHGNAMQPVACGSTR